MKKLNTVHLLAFSMLALFCLPGLAQTELGDDYQPGDYGRVRDAADGVTIVRAEWDQSRGGTEQGGINSPIFPGDALVAGSAQRAEVQLARGSMIWIDRNTELTFLSLPDPYAEFADNTVLQLVEGSMRLVAVRDDDGEFRIDTPATTIYPLGNADLRIEIDGSGHTTVFSRSGVAEVVGAGGSVILRGGMSTEVVRNSVPSDPRPANTFAGDDFDRWVEQRERGYEYRDGYAEADPGVYEELPREVKPYYRELSAHGTWIDTEDYGRVWSPTVVATDWRPYYDGYWNYGRNGYFWVSQEPWGWAPYHYGRWTWIGSNGWCWSPGSVFAGAWVAWSWGSVHVGWSALDYWNYPAYRHHQYHGYYDPYAWSFVSYSHLHHYDYRHHRVHYDQVRHDGHHRSAVVTRPPRVSPHDLARSEESRQLAVRRARDDTGSRLAPVDRQQRPSKDRAFRTAENRRPRPGTADTGTPVVSKSKVVRDRRLPGEDGRDRRLPGEDGRDRRVAGNDSRDRRVPGQDGRNRGASSPGARSSRSPAKSDRLPVVDEPRYPRKLTTSDSNRRSTRPVTTRRVGSSKSSRDNRAEPLGTSERLRDIYRQMARPRPTREKSSSDATARRGSGGEQRVRPRSSSGSRGDGAKARPPSPSGRGKAPAAERGRANTPKRSPGANKPPTRNKKPAARSSSPSGRSRGSTPRAGHTSSRNSAPGKAARAPSRRSAPSAGRTSGRGSSHRKAAPSRKKSSRGSR